MEALSRFEPGTVVPLQSKHVFTLEKRLGRGAEGVVFLAQLEQDEEKGEPGSQPIYAAVKILAPRLHASHDVDDERKRLAMAALSGKLGERFVRGFVTKTLDGRFDVHVMEYVEGGDLLAHVTSSKEGCIDEGRLRPIVWDMATAVRDAKRLGAVMIMDMKPENLLMLPDGGVKVCDVGCLVSVDACGVPKSPETVADNYTPEYAAPEIVHGAWPVSLRPAAIFTLGAVAKALLGHHQPSPTLLSLLDAMTQPAPCHRPNIHGVLQHPWFHDA